MLKSCLLPHGRLSRLGFWRAVAIIGILYLVVEMTIIVAFAEKIPTEVLGALLVVPMLIALYASAVVCVRRLHDRDLSAWWLLLSLVPVGGPVWYLFANGTIPGSVGPNRFGMSGDARHAIVETFEGRAPTPIPNGRSAVGVAVTVGLWVILLIAAAIAGVLFQNAD